MRLKRLELVGFKSFASRVCLEFGRGITAIVGPNGSGKSNISDAIRWVLGEQSARSLRGSKMEDVIFSGSDGKKPLGMAEVQLTLDNSEGFLPLDFSEVTVTRRVYRSGQSEFLINGRQCRLRDIQDLFTDTGLGKEGYALIGQGQIDAVLSVRSHDRRVVLEETAGIVKYRLRKEEALQKIEQTNQDLVRVTDILRELDQRLGPLHREAEKARRYQILGEKLLLAEQDYYGLELQRLERECAALGEERQSLLETAATVKAKQLRLEETISQLDQDLACLTQDLEAGQARQFELAEQHSSLANAIDVKSERLRNTAERLQALAELCAAKLAQLDTLQAQRRALLAELQRALETCRLTETRIEGADQALRAKQGQRQQLRQELENSQNEFFEFMRSLAELRNFQRSFAKDEQALLRQIEAKEQAAADSAARIEQLKSSAAETDKLRSTKAEQAAQTRQEAEALQKEQRDLQVQAEQQKARLGRIQAQITQLHARLNTLQELDADYEGYTASVRRLMQARSHRELVLGTVADVLKVPPGLELAFEVALGSALQNIITPDEAAAQTLIEWLKSNHAGRATFLPLDAMRPSLFPPNSLKLLRQPGVLGTGLELAEFEERFRPVVASLLGRVVFTEDLDAAVALRRTLQQFSRIVTRDGSVVYPSGAMTGGSQTTRTSGLLSRKQEIHQLQESIAREREAAEAHKQTLGRLEAALTRVDSRLQTIAEEQVASQLGLQRLEQNLEQLQKEIGREKEHHSRLLLEAEQLVQSRETLLAQQETAAAQLAQEEAAESHHRSVVRELEERLAKLESVLEEAQSGITQLRIQLAEEKGVAENLRMQLTTVDNQIAENQSTLSQARTEQDNLSQLQSNLSREIAAAQAELERNEQARNELGGRLERLKQEREGLQGQLKELNARLKQVNAEHAQAERKLYRLESDLKLKAAEAERIFELLRERGLEPEQVQQRQIAQPKSVLRQTIDELREQIRSLGMVNPTAVQEYEEVKERHHFLTMQLEDLNAAKDQLHKVIAEMDEVCRSKFEETFAQVRTEFRKLFTELFQGGRADLCLTEPDSPLTTGIEVVAQPPGKKLQNLLLLSGGERALTAIALLFAIRRVKPTPFCVLDEIDAALDEINLRRFTKLMQEFSETTQLLTITHRQATMEAADALYGVTMSEEAVSQIISVSMKLEG